MRTRSRPGPPWQVSGGRRNLSDHADAISVRNADRRGTCCRRHRTSLTPLTHSVMEIYMSITLRTTRARIGLEALEDRLTPASALIGGNIVIVSGVGNDAVTVNTVGAFHQVTENGVSTFFAAAAVTGGII